jgi:hypothetical protein
MTVSINGTSGLVFNDASTQNTSAFTGGFAFRNRIINSAMVIDQRNAGAAVTTDGSYPVDRFFMNKNNDGAFSAQRDTSAPAGFINSIKITTTTADSSLTTVQNLTVFQRIEGLNVADFGWGTSSAATVTLSFWVRSSLTGTFGGSITNNAFDRSYPFTYSISSANTWEQKTVTIAGDTTGTWLTTNGTGVQVNLCLGAGPDRSGTAGAWSSGAYLSATGATSVIGTLNATWYVTGVQLEKGSTATSFDYRPYGTELSLCQRYYIQLGGNANQRYGVGWWTNTTNGYPFCPTPVTMRDPANASVQYSSLSHFAIYSASTASTPTAITFDSGSNNAISILVTVASGGTAGYAAVLLQANASAKLGFSNEL